MTPEKLSVYFDTSPAIGLFKADHSPFVVCFLFERFKRAHVIDIPHSDLLPALAAYQERLHDLGNNALRDKPEDLLRIWSSSEKRWLHRHLEVGRTEALYQLTPHSEAVIEFVSKALQQDLTFVGTESRLRLVMQALEELSIKTSDDPQVRLKYLREQQARIVAEIEEIDFPSGELHPSNGGAGCQGTWCSGDGFRGERDARALRSCDGRHQGTCASLRARALGVEAVACLANCQR